MGLKKNILIGASALAFMLSTGYGVKSCVDMSSAEDKLMTVYEYRQAGKLSDIASKVNTAESELEYHASYLTTHCSTNSNGGLNCSTTYHPAVHPDCREARNAIAYASSSITQLGANLAAEKPLEIVAEQEMKLLGNEAAQLSLLHESLPDANELKEYNGKDVDNSTFETQRKELESIRHAVNLERKANMAKVPAELLSEKNKAIGFGAGSWLAAFGSIVLGFYAFRRND